MRLPQTARLEAFEYTANRIHGLEMKCDRLSKESKQCVDMQIPNQNSTRFNHLANKLLLRRVLFQPSMPTPRLISPVAAAAIPPPTRLPDPVWPLPPLRHLNLIHIQLPLLRNHIRPHCIRSLAAPLLNGLHTQPKALERCIQLPVALLAPIPGAISLVCPLQ